MKIKSSKSTFHKNCSCKINFSKKIVGAKHPFIKNVGADARPIYNNIKELEIPVTQVFLGTDAQLLCTSLAGARMPYMYQIKT